MVMCYNCKHCTNVVQLDNRTEKWNKYCSKKEQIVTDTLFDAIQCTSFTPESIADLMGMCDEVVVDYLSGVKNFEHHEAVIEREKRKLEILLENYFNMENGDYVSASNGGVIILHFEREIDREIIDLISQLPACFDVHIETISTLFLRLKTEEEDE